MTSATNNQSPCSNCCINMTLEKKIALAVVIVGIALSVLAVSAYFVPFPAQLSFFKPIVKIVATSLAGTLIAGVPLYFAIKCAMYACRMARERVNTEANQLIAILHKDEIDKGLADLSFLAGLKVPEFQVNVTAEQPRESQTNAAAKQLIANLRKAAIDKERSDQLFGQKYGLLCKKLNVSRADLQTMDKEGWKRIEQKVNKWANQTSTLCASKTDIQWVTGTRSPALIGIANAAKKGLASAPALVPTGELIDANIVPFTGELASGIMPGYVNTKALSGAPFKRCSIAYNYATCNASTLNQKDELQFILHCSAANVDVYILRLKIAVLRLIHSGADEATLQQAKEHLQKNILPQMHATPTEWQVLARLIGSETKTISIPPITHAVQHPLPQGTLVSVKRSDETIKFAQIVDYNETVKSYQVVLDHQGTKKWVAADTMGLYDQIEISSVANNLPPLFPKDIRKIESQIIGKMEYRKHIEEMLNLFDTEKALQLSDQEKEFVNQPFPLIWGTTLEPSKENKFIRVQSDMPELAHEGALNLGSDITVVFTKAKKIETLKTWLCAQNINFVSVMSLGAMAYLHATQKS